MTRSKLFFASTLFVLGSYAFGEGPDCSGGWPTTMTLVHLKNAGMTDNEKVDSAKTKTTRMASEKIGKDLYHQVYDVQYTEKSGKLIEAIAVHNASSEECSMTGVEVFVVSKHLNDKFN
jgi:hypothetical protein